MNLEEEAYALLLEKIKEVSDEQLDESFIGALKFTKEQKNLLTFVFWLCYMTETDLNDVLKESWSKSISSFKPEVVEEAKKIIFSNLKGYRNNNIEIKEFISNIKIDHNDSKGIIDFVENNYQLKREFLGIENLEYFIDKIKIYELFFGQTKRTKLLYKINNIRNDLSHNRIDELKYKGKSLFDRDIKEELIKDYFDSAFNNDEPKSNFLDFTK